MNPQEKSIKELMEKYVSEIDTKLKNRKRDEINPGQSSEYNEFKKTYLPAHFTWYEKACNFSEKIIKIAPDKKREAELREAIEICHLNASPIGISSFAFIGPFLVALIGSMMGLVLFHTLYFVYFSIFLAVLLIVPLQKLPLIMADGWRMKASNQMVICIFYVVTHMRHTSNLELAVKFAAEHLNPPLALDLKKVLWDVETEKYESVKESMDHYLGTWRQYNMEFVESFHLIMGSLYESSEERRIQSLEKSLTVILEQTYEKMIRYAHDLKGPISMLHMLGVILPILGLVILPLIVSFIGNTKWYHISSIYNILLPLGVLYLGLTILSKRPSGYGDADIAETNPALKKYMCKIIKINGKEVMISPAWEAIGAALICILIGISPIIIHMLAPTFDITIGGIELLHYMEVEGKSTGPFGILSAVLSLGIPLGIALGFGIYYNIKSARLMEIRNRSKQLEQEFASALFQLGNRLADGIPAEIAFARVADTMQGTVSGAFFENVNFNIRHQGMDVETAIFDKEHGAINQFPSNMVISSMKVLVESSRKGPLIASQAIISVSNYIQEMHRVNERLEDLMAEVVSSMKAQISFMTPAISGIVIGITAMVSLILIKLGEQMTQVMSGKEIGGVAASGGMSMLQMFKIAVPTYHFQIIVGLYVVQIIFILTILTNIIENGSDKLNERYMLGQNLIKGPALYVVTAGIMMLLFSYIAVTVLKGSMGGG